MNASDIVRGRRVLVKDPTKGNRNGNIEAVAFSHDGFLIIGVKMDTKAAYKRMSPSGSPVLEYWPLNYMETVG
jgi:hypothetical protein